MQSLKFFATSYCRWIAVTSGIMLLKWLIKSRYVSNMVGNPSAAATEIMFVNEIDFSLKKSLKTLNIDLPFKVLGNSSYWCISSTIHKTNRTHANKN